MSSKLYAIVGVVGMMTSPAYGQLTVDFFGGARDFGGAGVQRVENFDDNPFRTGVEETLGPTNVFISTSGPGANTQRAASIEDSGLLDRGLQLRRNDPRNVGLVGFGDAPDQEIGSGTPGLNLSTDPNLPIFFDAFLADNGGMPADNFNAFFQWVVTGGSVNLVGQPVVDPFGNPVVELDQRGGPLFGRFVDLAGSLGAPGIFATRFSFPFLQGRVYSLSFDFNSIDGNPATATVTIGSQVFTVSTSSTSFTRFSRNFIFVSTTIAGLAFQSQGGRVGIDNVILAAR